MKRIAIVAALVPFQLLLAQTGSLSIRTVDARTGAPLPGTNVTVLGTVLGGASNAEGDLVIGRIAPGVYAVQASLIGYERTRMEGVGIRSGETTRLQIRLSATAIPVDPVIVTATRREQSAAEAPASVSVLDARGISERNSVTLDDALRYIPGVNITESQVNVRGSSGYNRGAGSRVLLLVDGMPMLTGDTGEINFETMAVDELERIEVVKGASSALYGSSALGGVINLITVPIPVEPVTRISMFGGVFGPPSYDDWDWSGGARTQYGVSVSHARTVGDLGARVFVGMTGSDSHRRNDNRKRVNGALTLRYALSPSTRASLSVDIMDQPRDNFLFWRGLDRALEPPDDQLGARISSTRAFTSASLTVAGSAELTHTARVSWYHNRFSDNFSIPGSLSLSDVFRGDYLATWLASPSHVLTGGVEGSYDMVDANIFGVRQGWGLAAFAQDEITLTDVLTLTLGLRYDVQDVDSLETVSQLNPKAAVLYHPFAGTALRLSAGRGFRSPSIAEAFTSTSIGGIVVVPNPSLRPERSVSLEAGVKQALGPAAAVDIALFQSDYDDLIESGLNASGKAQLNNVTRARVQGVEIVASAALNEGPAAPGGSTSMSDRRSALFSVGYTYVYPRDLTTNDLLKYRPRHLLYASAEGFAGPMSLGVDYRYLSRVDRVDETLVNAGYIVDGAERVPIHVLDARATWKTHLFGSAMQATFNVKNILQYNYVELIAVLAPPRTYLLSLAVTL
jgi:iron complex outermembrane receptor protein